MQLKLLARTGGEAIFYHNGKHYSGAELISQSAHLAAQLHNCSAVINLADNRLDFVIGFLAALIAKKTTILPANSKLETVHDLLIDCPEALLVVSSLLPWDIDQRIIPQVLLNSTACASNNDEYWIDGQFPAVCVYTSGSTGKPKANKKTWQALVRTAEKLYQRFAESGVLKPGSYLMGTVPSQHMYGLETLVMLPLVSPVIGLVERGLLPDYLMATAQSAPQPVVLISSPIHVGALAQQGADWSGFAAIVSATAPLDAALAQHIEQQHRLGVWEIYGCTEAGSMATRRTAETVRWQFLPGIKLSEDAEHCAVEIDHLGAQIPLQDQINMHSDGLFILGPRNSDLIKIAGKRGSIAQITALIRQHPQISDAYVFISNSKFTRLSALVCATADADDIKRFLAQKIDDVFVPRIIRHAASLPRNSNGKIIHEDVLTLWDSIADKKISQGEKLQTAEISSTITRSIEIPSIHAVFAAHFPGQPLVPAALLLDWIANWLMDANLTIIAVKSCKFLQPVLPGDKLMLHYQQKQPQRLTLKLIKDETVVVEGHFTVAPGVE
ncbi:MAG TPA: AMP-binding protein [Cellvibrionaceae bacterium]